MSALAPRIRRWLVWVAPFAVLALVIGWQTGWGTAWRRELPAEAPAVPAPVNVALMPEYRIDGGVASMRATVERPLFNATRRPAPAATGQGAAKPAIQRGQFVLTGTVIVDKVAIAFLKETSGAGKSRSVRQGDSINGMLVAAVEPDRVRFAVGDETEELELKVAKGPAKTTQPAEAAAPGGRPAGPAGAPAPGSSAPVRSAAQGGLSGPGSATENLRANRRAARANESRNRTQGAPAAPVDPRPGPLSPNRNNP